MASFLIKVVTGKQLNDILSKLGKVCICNSLISNIVDIFVILGRCGSFFVRFQNTTNYILLWLPNLEQPSRGISSPKFLFFLYFFLIFLILRFFNPFRRTLDCVKYSQSINLIAYFEF